SGSRKKACANASFCFIPRLKDRTVFFELGSNPTSFSHVMHFSFVVLFVKELMYSNVSKAVRCGQKSMFSMITPTDSGKRFFEFINSPLIAMLPLVGRIKPATDLNNIVFPDPFLPSNPTTVPD